MKVTIVLAERAIVDGISAPQKIFTAANDFLQNAGRKPMFEIELAGMKKYQEVQHGEYKIRATKLLDEVDSTDLLILPPVVPPMEDAIALNKKALQHVVRLQKSGAQVASLCTGSFLLGATGLADGLKCSTHWAYYNLFGRLFPEVEVVDGGIVTDQGNIYSSGGALSLWNLLMYLLEKFAGRQIALMAGKFFAIEVDRESQHAFTMFNGQLDHHDEDIKRAQRYIAQHITEKLSVDDLAALTHTGRRSFERRFRTATGNSVLEYIQRMKIEAAKRKLENTRSQVNEVMYSIGYNDVKAFRDVFKKITSLTPLEYRQKFAKLVRA